MHHFPETQRAFAHGELSVLMDRYGGLLDISLMNILHSPDRDYPDNRPLFILSRRAGKTINRPLTGPAIQILTECTNDTILHHTVLNPEIHPWGVRGEGEEMLLDGDRLFLRCKRLSPSAKSLHIAISQFHLCAGDFSTIKNQRVADGCREHCARAGVIFDPDMPVKNGTVHLSWQNPHLADNTLRFNGTLDYPYGSERIAFGITSSKPLRVETTRNLWILSTDWDENEDAIDLAIVFASENRVDSLNAMLQEAIKVDFAALFNQKIQQDKVLQENAAQVEIANNPLAGEFVRMAVPYQNSLLLHNTVGIRAAQFKYASFMMWDSLYPLRDLLWNGQYNQAVDIFRTFLGYPWMENSAWCVSQMILCLEEILSFKPNSALLDEAMPYLKNYLQFQLKLVNQETGLLDSFMNTGVDVPAELGLKGLYYAPCINGWWYGALRTLENWAIQRKDDALRQTVAPLIGKIEQYFLTAFLSPKTGALRSGIDDTLTPGDIEAFQNTSTIGLDYPYGHYLLRKALPQLAHYHACRLRHPSGYTALAWDTQVMCEAWKAVHMNQHVGHEAKLARLAGNLPEARRLLQATLDWCDVYHNAIETFNFSGCEGNETMTGDWQTFAATGICEGIRAGLAGIVRHAGGLHYLPADDDATVTMRNVRWNDAMIDIEITGSGSYLGECSVSGVPLKGTAQLPTDCLAPVGCRTLWRLTRSAIMPVYPVLLQACGMPVKAVSVTGKALQFTADASGHFPLQFAAPAECTVTLNGNILGKTDNGWFDITLSQNDIVTAVL